MTEKQPRRGRITGGHQRIHPDTIIAPRAGIGTFFNTKDGMLGVGLTLDDDRLGSVLIRVDATDIVGLHELLDWIVNLDDRELDELIERVNNRGEAN